MKVRVHKIASVVYRQSFKKILSVTDNLSAQPGNTVVVRALREKRVYSELELADGRMSKIFKGDVFVGALGRRRALRGFCGEVPSELHVGDTLQLLNRGGVLGGSTSEHMDFGQPVPCEVIGMPVRDGRIVRLGDHRIDLVETLEGYQLPPIVAVSGTGMDAGKTRLIAELIQQLAKSGLDVAGGKLTGIACLRDLAAMEDHGAVATASFLDVGHPSTAGLDSDELVITAKTVISELAASDPDLIVLELGDGILGEYGVLDIFRDEEIRAAFQMHIFCACDPAGAWGGHRYLAERGIEIDLFSGPVTDTVVGSDCLQRTLGVTSINAHVAPDRLTRVVRERLAL